MMAPAAETDTHRLETTQPSAAAWDAFVAAQPRAHVLQLSAWGELKARFGWQSQTVALVGQSGIQAGAQALIKRLPLGMAKMAYVPMGGFAVDHSLYPPLWRAIRDETGAAFLKLEPGHLAAGETLDLARMGFQRSPQAIQPPTTIILDIAAEDDAIMKRMNQGTRRKIRKSLASGIQFEEGSARDLPAFSALVQETGERNAFGVHSPAYFSAIYDLFMPRYGALLTARREGDLLAAVMVFSLGQTAWYLYGASSRAQGKLYAAYGIQWAAIQWAKRRGCRAYDFWGAPDFDAAALEAQFQTRHDGLWGVYGFKRGWGGTVRRSLGSWDLSFNPLLYTAYRAALKLRS